MSQPSPRWRAQLKRVRDRLTTVGPAWVRVSGDGRVRVFDRRGRHRLRPDDPAARRVVMAGTLRINAADPVALVTLASSGVLRGRVRRLRLRLADAPDGVSSAVRPHRFNYNGR